MKNSIPTSKKVLEKLKELEAATKESSISMEDILIALKHMFEEKEGKLGVMGREKVIRIIRDFGISDRSYRMIFQLLEDLRIVYVKGRLPFPGKMAKPLFNFAQDAVKEIKIPENIWKEIQESAKAEKIDIRVVFTVVKHLFTEREGKIFCKGRERLVKEVNRYNIGGRKVRRILEFLTKQKIIAKYEDGKKRFPTILGRILFEELNVGKITCVLPPISDKLTDKADQRKKNREEYIEHFLKTGGQIPNQEESLRLLSEIWDLPTISRVDLARLVTEESSVNTSAPMFSKYKLGERSIPDHVRIALLKLHERLDPKQLKQILDQSEAKRAASEKKAIDALLDLFNKGLPYPEIANELKTRRFNVSRDEVYSIVQGDRKLDIGLAECILAFHQEFMKKYPFVPSPQEVSRMIKELNDRGYSTRGLAERVHKSIRGEKASIIAKDSMRTILERFRDQPDRKKTMHIAYRIAVQQVFAEINHEENTKVPPEILKITKSLERIQLAISSRHSKYSKKEILSGLAVILAAKMIQEFVYEPFHTTTVSRPRFERMVAPIGSRNIAAYAKSKGLEFPYNEIEFFSRKMGEMGLLSESWITEMGKKIVSESVGDLSVLFEPDMFWLTRIRVLTFKSFKELLAILRFRPGIPQTAISRLFRLKLTAMHDLVKTLERYKILKRNMIGDVFLTELGGNVADKIEEIPQAKLKRVARIDMRVKVSTLKAFLGDILFDFFLEQEFSVKPIHTVKPVGETWLDRLYQTDGKFVAVELKATTKDSWEWRKEQVYKRLLKHLSILLEEKKQLADYSIVLTTASIGSYLELVKFRKGMGNKTYTTRSGFKIKQETTETGIIFVGIPIDCSKGKLQFEPRNIESVWNKTLKNEKWIEVRIIGEEFLRRKLKDNPAALLLIEFLQKPWYSIQVPENVDSFIEEWRRRIKERNFPSFEDSLGRY